MPDDHNPRQCLRVAGIVPKGRTSHLSRYDEVSYCRHLCMFRLPLAWTRRTAATAEEVKMPEKVVQMMFEASGLPMVSVDQMWLG